MKTSDLFAGAAVWTKVGAERRRVVIISETSRATRGRQMTGRRERCYRVGHVKTSGEREYVEELPKLRSAKQLHRCGHGYDAFAPLGVADATVPVCVACDARYENSKRDANRDATGN